MRLKGRVLAEVAKGFHSELRVIDLSWNKMEKEGVKALATQIKYGQGGQFVDDRGQRTKGKLHEKAVEWGVEELSLSFNEINDFAIDDISAMSYKLMHLRKLDLDGNLFFGVQKLRNL